MKIGLVIAAVALAGFGGGWFAHKETQSRCYVLPGYTEPASSNSFLRPSGGVNPPELVCK